MALVNTRADGYDDDPADRNPPLVRSDADRLNESWGSLFPQLNAQYQTSLKRNAGETDWGHWLQKNAAGNAWEWTRPDWSSAIDQSQEARALRGGGGTTGGGYDPNALRQALLAWNQPANAANLARFIAENPQFATGVRIGGSKNNKLWGPNGEYLGDVIRGTDSSNPAWDWDTTTAEQAAARDASTPYGNSPSTELYINEILSRLQQLRNPEKDPFLPLLQTLALKQVDQLGKAPYTEGEEAALVTQYRDPLTQARDAQLQMNRERIGARGMAASSGLLDYLNQQTQADYTQGIARGTNDLGVRAVAQKQANSQQALSVLAAMVATEKARRDEINQQSQSLVETAALLPGMDERRLKLLLDAAGNGSDVNSSLSQLLQLAQLGQQTNWQNNAESDATRAAIGQAIARVLETLGKK